MFKFFNRKKNNVALEPEVVDNSVRDRSDVSNVYDYDKIKHNQFLTDDTKYGEHFEGPSLKQTINESHKDLKKERMLADELAFSTLKKTINLNLGNAQKGYHGLYHYSSNLKESEQKIPIKKRNLFSKKNNPSQINYYYNNDINQYNIVEEQTKMYENDVNYNKLRNEQTKLLDLSDLDSSDDQIFDIKQPTLSLPKQTINIDDEIKTTDSSLGANLTNRLFAKHDDSIESQPKQETTVIPRKTIRLSFAAQTAQESSSNNSQNNTNTQMYANMFNSYATEKNYQSSTTNVNLQNSSSIQTNNQSKDRISTTALRYLTPIDEDVEDLRIKKENRRFLKHKD